MNSVPWSETIRSGLPRQAKMASSSRATLRPEIEVSAIAARHSFGDVVDHVEDAEAPPVRKPVVDEVDRPAGVRPRLDQERRPHARRPLASPALADGQALLALKPLRLLSIQNVALGAQNNVQPSITEPALLGSQFPQAAAQGVVSRSTRSVADGPAIGLYQAARPALAHLADGYETDDSLALGGGRQDFFVTRSFSAALSSIASARGASAWRSRPQAA
jgi:hypothetical protein